MRICMILSSPLPAREGIGFYAWNLALQLTAQGHPLHLITRRQRQHIQTRYSWNIISQNYLHHYQSILGGNRA